DLKIGGCLAGKQREFAARQLEDFLSEKLGGTGGIIAEFEGIHDHAGDCLGLMIKPVALKVSGQHVHEAALKAPPAPMPPLPSGESNPPPGRLEPQFSLKADLFFPGAQGPETLDISTAGKQPVEVEKFFDTGACVVPDATQGQHAPG